MAEVLANGVRLYYEEHGAGAPILCIHGTGSSAIVWRSAAVDALAQLGRTIVYDRRGCTRSERPEPFETGVPEHAEDAASLLEALGAVPAVVIGRSYGGEVALELALRYPDRVRALVLLEAALLEVDPDAREWDERFGEMIEAAAARDPGSVGEAMYRLIVGDETWESWPAALREMIADNSPAILAEIRGPHLEGGAATLSEITVPTLLVTGAESPAEFRRASDRLAEAIPGSRTVLVEGGHLIDPGHPEILHFVGAFV